MLRYVKKITKFAFISVGVSFVLFLFFGNADPSVNSFEIDHVGGGALANKYNLTQPSGTFNRLIDGYSRVLGISDSNPSTETEQKSDETNLTEIFGKLMANNLIEANPKGSQIVEGEESFVIPGSLSLADPILGQNFVKIRDQIMSPVVDEIKLNIIETTKQEDLENYFWTIESEYLKLFEGKDFEMNVTDLTGSLKNIEIMENIFESYLKILYSMPAPSVFKEFHIKAVAATESGKAILGAMLDFQNDPLKALLMKDLYKDLITKVANLTKEEISLMQKYGVTNKRTTH